MQARVFRASDEREGPRRDSGEYWSPRSNQTALARRIAGDSRTTLRGVHTDSSGLHQTQVQGQPACGARSSTRPPKAASTLLVAGGTKIVFTTFTAAAGRNTYTVTADRSRMTPITCGGLRSFQDPGTHPLDLYAASELVDPRAGRAPPPEGSPDAGLARTERSGQRPVSLARSQPE